MNGGYDYSQFDRVVANLEKVTDRLSEVAGELKLIAERQLAMSGRIDRMEHDIRVERDERISLRRDLDKWINRGWGAWGVIAASFAVIAALVSGFKGWIGPPSERPKPQLSSPATTEGQ